MTSLPEILSLDAAELGALVHGFARRGWTIATAESLTAGLLAATLAEVPGASNVLRGGIVCYATDLKESLVGVDAALLARQGPVDPDVAGQLAEGARRRCGADVGVGLTGVAGPSSQAGHAPGTVYVACHGPGERHALRMPSIAPGSTRWHIRAAAVRVGLEMLGEVLAGTVGNNIERGHVH